MSIRPQREKWYCSRNSTLQMQRMWNNFPIDYFQVAEKEKKRRFGLAMYLEGLGFHSTGRLLNVSHVSVMNWVKKYGSELSKIRNSKPVQVMELDELHSYVGSKKKLPMDMDCC